MSHLGLTAVTFDLRWCSKLLVFYLMFTFELWCFHLNLRIKKRFFYIHTSRSKVIIGVFCQFKMNYNMSANETQTFVQSQHALIKLQHMHTRVGHMTAPSLRLHLKGTHICIQYVSCDTLNTHTCFLQTTCASSHVGLKEKDVVVTSRSPEAAAPAETAHPEATPEGREHTDSTTVSTVRIIQVHRKIIIDVYGPKQTQWQLRGVSSPPVYMVTQHQSCLASLTCRHVTEIWSKGFVMH